MIMDSWEIRREQGKTKALNSGIKEKVKYKWKNKRILIERMHLRG